VSFATADPSAPLRGVVVGAGAIGPRGGYELHHSPDVAFTAWVDLVPERARAAAAALGAHDVAIGADVVAVLDELRPDFIVNVSPPAAHHAISLAALDRGVHVLSEKPLAATLAQATEMISAANRNERLLMVSQNRRYYPGLIAFRDTVAQLGRLSHLTCQFFIAHRDAAAEFLFGFPDPLLLDMAIHLFDAARAITGADPRDVEPAVELVRGRRRRRRDLRHDRRAAVHIHPATGRATASPPRGPGAGARPASAAARSGRTRERRSPRPRPATASRRSRGLRSSSARRVSPGSSSPSPSSSTRSAPAASRRASATTTSARWPCATPRSSRRAPRGA
jgi:predicted dehydrogenase